MTTRRINFIVDNTEDNAAVDGLDCTKSRDQEKDRSWSVSSLHQIYSRRCSNSDSMVYLFVYISNVNLVMLAFKLFDHHS